MKPSTFNAFVTEEYTDQCPKCGGPMQQVPYFSSLVRETGTHREIASLTRDRIVTTQSLSFITPVIGGYCPACTAKAIDKENEAIRERNKLANAQWDSLSERERKARTCPGLTVAFLVCLALALLMLVFTLVKVIDTRASIALLLISAILSAVFGLGSWASNDGLFPLRHRPPEAGKQELYDAPSYTAEELARKIVDQRRPAAAGGVIAMTSYYTPGDLQRMQR